MEDLMTTQLELEQAMQTRGAAKFKKEMAKAKEKDREASTVYGRKLVAKGITPVSEAIQEFISKANQGGAGRRHTAVKFLQHIDPATAAFIALKVCLDGIGRKRNLQNVAIAIGHEIENEVRFTKFEEMKKPLFKAVKKHVERSNAHLYKSRVMTYAMNKYGVEWTSWLTSDKLQIGQKIIELIAEHTGFIEIVTTDAGKSIWNNGASKKTTMYRITATQACLDWIERYCKHSELLCPEMLPCVVKPKSWTSVYGGGYYSENIPALKLVKTPHQTYMEELNNRIDDMPVLYRAINALQDTGWKINTDVLEVMENVWTNGGARAGLPNRENEVLPPCPVCGSLIDHEVQAKMPHACFEKNKEAHKEWKRAATLVHAANSTSTSQRIQVEKTMWIARKFQDFESIYFPYQLDFRGRIYAVPMYLNPQGPDFAKALLKFSEGKAIVNDEGEMWLAIQGANTYGNDKTALEDRHQWVLDNEEHILAVAADPYDTRWWMDADDPWLFLAFCFEWTEYRKHGRGFVSTLPVNADGSCNGLQIFSLMLRDEIGGRATNVIPSEKGTPEDIYQIVADKTTAVLRRMTYTGEKVFKKTKSDEEPELLWDEKEYAQMWLDLNISRKTTKRQVMVLPYGGTQHSCREYTEEWLKDIVLTDHPWFGETFRPSLFLSKIIWDCIGETVIAARDAMAFLQKLARVAASEGLPVTWTTPTGFTVLQAYPDLQPVRVRTKMGDSILKLTVNEMLDTLDKRRQASGISPNFVHSLDAAALMWTVNDALDHGITSFAMIHDSYGVPAQDAAQLGRCLRDVFVRLFTEHDVLAELRNDVAAMLPEEKAKELPELPPVGDLDVEKVRDSAFFFA